MHHFQGGCGSCVAFATVGALEASINYKTNLGVAVGSGVEPATDLSEQQLYFCLGKRGCGDGWWLWEAAVFAASSIVDETCMPYDTEKVGATCTKSKCPRTPGTVKGGTVQVVTLNSWEEVKKHIINHGPVITTLIINTDFPGFDDNPDMYNFPSNYVWPGSKTKKVIGAHGGHRMVNLIS